MSAGKLLTTPVIARIIFCLILLATAIWVFDTGEQKWRPDFPGFPLYTVLKFSLFCLCSIAFWHIALFHLIFAAGESPGRTLIFRALDYVWYFTAIMSAMLVINEMQIDNAKASLETVVSQHQAQKNGPGSKEFVEACTYYLAHEDEIPLNLRPARQNIELLCAIKRFGRHRSTTKFLEACENANLFTFPQFPPPATPMTEEEELELLFKVDSQSSLLGLAQSCIDWKKEQEFRDRVWLSSRDISWSEWLPVQRSGMWLYLLGIVVGLRLTKTTAECFDAVRNARAALTKQVAS